MYWADLTIIDWLDALWARHPTAQGTGAVKLCLDNIGRLAVTDALNSTVNLLYNGTETVAAIGVSFGAYLLDNGNFVVYSPTCEQLAETGAIDMGSIPPPPCLMGRSPTVASEEPQPVRKAMPAPMT